MQQNLYNIKAGIRSFNSAIDNQGPSLNLAKDHIDWVA